MTSEKFDEQSGYWPPDDKDGELATMLFIVMVLLTWFAGAASGALSFMLTIAAIAGWVVVIRNFSPDEDE